MSKPPTLTMRGAIPPLEGPQSDTIDLLALLRILHRRLVTGAAVALLIFSAVVIYTLQQTPRFEATAAVAIETSQSDAARLTEIAQGLPIESTVVDTQVELIRSRSIAERVVNLLDLTNDPEFNPSLREASWLDRAKAFVRNLVVSVSPNQFAPSEAERERLQLDATVSTVLDGLSAARAGRTLVINISFLSTRAERAQAIANAFAEQYIQAQLDAKRDTADTANQLLDHRLVELRERLRASEEAVEAYRIEHNLQPARGVTLVEQQLGDLNTRLVTERAELAEAEARLNSVRTQVRRGSADTVSEVLSSPLISALRGQQAEVARQQAELASRYGPRHPDIERVANQLTDIEGQIAAEVRRIVSSLESDVAAAREGVRSIQSSIEEMREELNVNNRDLVEMRELERQATADRELYDLFLERYRETGEERELSEADATVVSRATLPGRPSSPNLILNIVLAFGLAGAAGFAAALFSETLDRGLRTGRDVERVTGLADLGSLPKIGKTGGVLPPKPADHVVSKPMSLYAEALRKVRASILLSNIDNPPNIVALTSSLPGEGKTATAFALARVSAAAGSRTVVVDCDIRRRGLTKRRAHKSVEAGLVEVLTGEAEYDAALTEDKNSGSILLPLSDAESTPRDVFNTQAFDTVLARLRSQFDLVILDCPPVLAVADALTIAAKADAVVMLIQAKKTSRDAVKSALEVLQQANCRMAGATLNQVSLKERGGTAGDQYYYYKKLAEYYQD